MHTYIYIYRERERDRERDIPAGTPRSSGPRRGWPSLVGRSSY